MVLEAGDLLSVKGDAGFPFGSACALLGEGVGRGGGALVGGPLAAAVAVEVSANICLRLAYSSSDESCSRPIEYRDDVLAYQGNGVCWEQLCITYPW